MRPDKEIDAELATLRSMQPFVRNTSFCPDNTKKIAAQIEVLEGRMTERAIEKKWWEDETAEEYQEGDNDVWSDALAAFRWMNGDEGELAPSHDDLWGALVKSNGWKPPKTLKAAKIACAIAGLFCALSIASSYRAAAQAIPNDGTHAYATPKKFALEWKLGSNYRLWLTAFNQDYDRDFVASGWNPSFTYLISDYKPVSHKLANGKWETTFVSEIAENLP